MKFDFWDDDNRRYFVVRNDREDKADLRNLEGAHLFHCKEYTIDGDGNATMVAGSTPLTRREVMKMDGGREFLDFLTTINARYFVKTNAYNMLVVVAHDDDETAAAFDVTDLKEADNMDCSNIITMTAKQMKGEYDTFTWNPDEYERVIEL